MDSHIAWSTLPRMETIDGGARRIIRSLRLIALLNKKQACIAEHLVDQLGNKEAVRKFMLVAHAVGAAWPEPVTICAPCCPVMTHDERLLMLLVEAAAGDNRPAFDTLCRDMIGESERAHLYVAMRSFVLCYAHPRPVPLMP